MTEQTELQKLKSVIASVYKRIEELENEANSTKWKVVYASRDSAWRIRKANSEHFMQFSEATYGTDLAERLANLVCDRLNEKGM